MKTKSKRKSSKKVHQNHHKPLRKMKSVKKQKPQKKNKVKSLRKKKKHFNKKSTRRNRKKKGGYGEECPICTDATFPGNPMTSTKCCSQNICKKCTIRICNGSRRRCPFCNNVEQFNEFCNGFSTTGWVSAAADRQNIADNISTRRILPDSDSESESSVSSAPIYWGPG